MIRAPGINAVLNAASTLRQILSRKNVFEEVLSTREAQELCLRDVSSASLWLLACRRANLNVKKALAANCQTQVARSLAHCSELLRFGEAGVYPKSCREDGRLLLCPCASLRML